MSVPQIRLLARAFFSRLFESDLMPDGLPQVQLGVWGALLAAMPTTGYPVLVIDRYAKAMFFQPLTLEFAADRIILITLSMVAMGVVGLVIWDGVFPDRRDVRILGPIPIPTMRFVTTRLAALGQVYLLFVVPICVPQSIVFGLAVAGFGDPVPRLSGVSAHLAAVVLACTFVFCALIAIQCVLLLLFGRRAAQAASVVFQIVFAVGLVQLLFFLGDLGRVLREGGQTHEGLNALAALPATWFFGLYEALTGTGTASAEALARLGIGLTIASVLLATGMYASTYKTLSRRALEGPTPRSRHGRVRSASFLQSTATRGGFRSPLRTAIRQFTVRTFLKSRSHRMMLAVYAGVALAITISSALSVAFRDNGAWLWRPGVSLLSMPLVMQFFLLIGIRVVIAVPAEPKARWAFRAGEPIDRASAVTGARDVMMVLVVWPSVFLAAAQGLALWGPVAAVSHAVFSLALGSLFAEMMVARTSKLPFACTYFPGKSHVFTLWPLYVFVFFLYTLACAALDGALIGKPVGLATFCLVTFGLRALLAFNRRRRLAALPGLQFEEEDPDAIFEGFNLSEGLAAAPRNP